MTDPGVSFTNNIAKQAVCMSKVMQKMVQSAVVRGDEVTLVSRHRSDVVGCAQPSERSARRIAQPIPSCIGKRCNAAMCFDGQRRPTFDP